MTPKNWRDYPLRNKEVVFIIQDNVITFKKQDPGVPQTVSTSLEVLGLAFHSTLRPNGRFKSRARRFLALRVQYTVKATSSFNLQRNLIVYGDISSNPGPKRTKISPKYQCSESQKAVSHSKCLQMSRPIFQYYLDRPDIEWTCPTHVLPPLSDSFFAGFSEGELAEINVLESDREKFTQEDDAERSFGEEDEDIIYDNVQLELLAKHHSKDLLLAHLNINSVQNKFEELSAIIKTLRAHI